MRWIAYSMFVVGLAVTLPLVYAGESKLEPGFTSLFNGKDLTGWQTQSKKDKKGEVTKGESLEGKTEAYKGRFKVAGGLLAWDAGNAYIDTVQKFGKDVHFKFDFRPGPKCNNDILFRSTKFDIVPGNKENPNVKEGEWYTFELIATGDQIEHKINGVTARKTKAAAKESSITLRAEIGKMDVKNIRVK